MSGKDLFEGMSYVDERFVDEAETKTLPKRMVSPWIKVASMAACLCLIIFSLYNLQPYLNRGETEGIAGEGAADAMPAGAIEDKPEQESASKTESPAEEGVAGQVAADAMLEGGVENELEQESADSKTESPAEEGASRAPEMMIRVQEVTETGFIGTVQNNGGFWVFRDGTEITVTIDSETDADFTPEDYQIGDLIYVMYTTWDEDERTIVASILGVIDEPICD